MPDLNAEARERLAVGLDLPSLERAAPLIDQLAGVVGWLKIGSELFGAAGPAAIVSARRAARVFLDLKFHDIPNQVASAVRVAVGHGVSMLTLHSAGGGAMLRAAREAAHDEAARRGVERPRLVGVTVLTSLGSEDLAAIGVGGSLESQVARLVDLALESGLDGVVASAREAAAIRARSGPEFAIVTPGIRPAGSGRDDQTRTASPADAIQAGSTLLVVARPIVRAPEPAHAARAIVEEIGKALVAAQS